MRLKWNRLLVIPLLIIVVLAWVLWPQKDAEAGWYNDNWLYRLAYDITNSGSAINGERKIKLDIDTAALITAGKLQSDCDDARFTDANGKLLEYFIDTDSGACNTNSTDFYIKVPQVIAGKQTLYFYYGNTTAPRGRKNDFFADDSTGQGLKAYYKMDESSANTCSGGTNDTCDYALTNDGAWNGDVASTTGKVGNGTTFDGTGDYVDAGGNSSLLSLNQGTFSGWVKFANNSTIFSIGGVGNGGNCTSSQWGLQYRGDSGRGIQVYSYPTDGASPNLSAYTPNDTITDTNWHYIAITVDSSNLKIYVDGVNQTLSGTVSNKFFGNASTANKITFGRHYANACVNYLNGSLDDMRIYNRALSASEVTTIYNSGNGQNINVPLTFTQSATATGAEEQSPGPIASWSFDEGSGTVAQDSTENNLDLNFNGNPKWKSGSDCISGGCIYFDGSNDYLSRASTIPNTNYTISAWIKPNSTTASIVWWEQETQLYINLGNYQYRHWTGTSYTASTPATANQWTYVSVTQSTSNGLTIYIDGKLMATNVAGTPAKSIGSFFIGKDETTPTFRGYIDEVRIYPYARTAAQIQTDYNARGSIKGANAQTSGNSISTGDTLSNGLVAYYPMDEASANTCAGGVNDTCDRSGNGYDGAWTGTYTTATGKYGLSGDFAAGSRYVDIGDPSVFDFGSNDFTVSVWAKRKTGWTSWNAALVGKWNTGASPSTNEWDLILGGASTATDTTPAFAINSGSTMYMAISPNNTNNDQWYYVTGIRKNDYIFLYVDGVEVAKTYIGNISINNVSGRTLKIGRIDNASNGLDGYVDEVRIYNRALSPAEVQALYNFAPGPVAYWKIDDHAGQYAQDSSGNSNTATLGGSSSVGSDDPQWTTGKVGSAVSFDGSNDYIDAGTVSSLNFNASNEFTVEAWAKPTGTMTAWQTILAKGNQIGDASGYGMYVAQANQVRYRVREGGVGLLETSVTANVNQWTHLAFTVTLVNGTQYLTPYANGIKGTAASTASPYNPSTASNLFFGKTQNFFPGLIDDVKIYNYARTQAQILEDMNAGAPPATNLNPVAYWNFDEGYGTTANDSSGQGNNGTLTNMASPATSTSGWTNSGKFGKALAFDGTNDSVNTASVTLATAFSTSFWMKTSAGAARWRTLIRLTDNNSSFYIQNSNGPYLYLEGASSKNFTTTPVTDNVWHHVVLTRDTNNIVRVYVDTKKDANEPTKSGSLNFLGVAASGTSNEYYDGAIDEVKIFPYALTEDEVRLEYNRGSAVVFGAQSTDASGRPSNSSLDSYCPPASPAEASQCVGPVAEWKLDEGTGTSAQDTSGNANTGTLTNGPTWTRGKFGKAVTFDGSNDYISAGDVSNADFGTGDFTTSFWIKNTSTNHQKVYIAKDTWSGSGNGLLMYVWSGVYTYWNGSLGINSGSITINSWDYLTITRSSNTITTYLNGIKIATGTDSRNLSNSSNFTIASDSVGNQQFQGIIDNVRIYNYARSPAQIAWEYNQGAPVAHYQFDECQGTAAYNNALTADGTAAGNNGTITIGATGSNTSAGTCTGSTGEAWKDGATGKIGASLEFDGSDDKVVVADNNSLDLTDEFTLAAWIKQNGTGRKIITKGTSVGTTGAYIFDLDTSFRLRCYLENVAFIVTGTTAVNDNQWHHVICSRNSSNVWKIYLDGRLHATSTNVNKPTANTVDLGIGSHPDNASSATSPFSGQIDDVLIYNYPLSDSQIKTLYNGGAVAFK